MHNISTIANYQAMIMGYARNIVLISIRIKVLIFHFVYLFVFAQLHNSKSPDMRTYFFERQTEGSYFKGTKTGIGVLI